jgi:quercetin dioxygenase-like cupin family protein
MHLIRKNDAPFVETAAEARRYYLPDRDPLEVIETQMAAHAKQNAHSHEAIREAMLVLEGDVRVEEIISGKSFCQSLDPGDFVVFDRGVSHRMENNSDIPARILHFKFVGDWKDRALFISDKIEAGTNLTPASSIPDIYTQDYRHFDNLIWQVPAWASAIFALALTLAVLVLANGATIEGSLSVDAVRSVSVFLFSVFLILLLLLNVFLRFRLHQRVAHRPERPRVDRLWYMPPGQLSLQLILFTESAVVLCFALVSAGVDRFVAKAIAALFLILGFWYVEMTVRKKSAEIKASVR